MANFEFNVDDFLRGLDMADKRVQKGAERGMQDSVDELARVSSEIAPIDKGTLKKSNATKVSRSLGDNTIKGEVAFSIKETSRNGNFDYALWTHEEVYNHGAQTQKVPPTTSWSGKSYYAGRKYLERPLKGESDSFKKHIAEEIRKELT